MYLLSICLHSHDASIYIPETASFYHLWEKHVHKPLKGVRYLWVAPMRALAWTGPGVFMIRCGRSSCCRYPGRGI